MSHSPPMNYADGVPVKISEKYKPPPEIRLSTKLTQQLAKYSKTPVAFEDYNFDLERKIYSKTTEWINWRLKEKTERQQRIQQRELARQKRLEEEQKAKLNQVSYPSDDLTSEEDEQEIQDSIEATPRLSKNVNDKNSEMKNQIIPSSSERVFSPNFNTILMPTQAVNQSNVTDKKSHRRYASNSSNKIDFSFFESDASPFDNLEIKSMNEMEELAKVLQSTAVVENNLDSDENTLFERNYSSESEPSDTSGNNNNNSSSRNDSEIQSTATAKVENNPYQPHPHNNFNPQQQLYNNYYYGMPSSTATNNQQSYYSTQQRFGTATTTPAHTQQFSSTPYVMNHIHQLPNNHHYYTQNYAVNHMNYTQALNMTSSNNNHMACENSDIKILDDASSKSRSVPDIVKELSDELNNSERRRIRNISQSNQKSDEIGQYFVR